MTKIVNGQSIKINAAPSRRLNLKYFNAGIFAAVAVLGVFYLVNITSLTVQGFVLSDLKAQAAKLSAAEMNQEEAVDEAQSYDTLTARTAQLKMVPVDNVDYLSSNNSAVAQK